MPYQAPSQIQIQIYIHPLRLGPLRRLFLPFLIKKPLNLRYDPEIRPKSKTPTPNPHGTNEKVHQRPVTNAETQEDSKVSPLVLGLDVERSHVVDTGAVLAVSAVSCGFWIDEVAGYRADECLGVGVTG